MNVPLRRLRPYVHRIEPVLGTRLDVTAVARSAGRADGVIDRLLSEIDRLERVFSIYDPTSELRRWSAGEVPQPSTDLQALLIAGEVWMERTGGVFSPTLGRLTQRWPLAETEGSLPTDGELAGLATTVTALPYRVRADGAVEQLGPCDALDFQRVG